MEYFVSNNLDINKFYESAYPFFSIYLGEVGEQSSSLSRHSSRPPICSLRNCGCLTVTEVWNMHTAIIVSCRFVGPFILGNDKVVSIHRPTRRTTTTDVDST